MASPAVFTRNLFARARAVERNSGNALQVAVVTVTTSLVSATPVGGPPTSPRDPHPGLARSNWQVFPGAVSAASIRPVTSAGEAISRAGSLAAAASPDGSFTVSNPVPYMDKLNNGSSTQAPAGFVELSIAAAQAALGGIVLLGRR